MHYAYKVHTEGEKARSSFVIKFRGVSNSRTHLSQPNLAPERRRAMARKDVAARRAMARFSAERGALLCIAVSEWRRPRSNLRQDGKAKQGGRPIACSPTGNGSPS